MPAGALLLLFGDGLGACNIGVISLRQVLAGEAKVTLTLATVISAHLAVVAGALPRLAIVVHLDRVIIEASEVHGQSGREGSELEGSRAATGLSTVEAADEHAVGVVDDEVDLIGTASAVLLTVHLPLGDVGSAWYECISQLFAILRPETSLTPSVSGCALALLEGWSREAG